LRANCFFAFLEKITYNDSSPLKNNCVFLGRTPSLRCLRQKGGEVMNNQGNMPLIMALVNTLVLSIIVGLIWWTGGLVLSNYGWFAYITEMVFCALVAYLTIRSRNIVLIMFVSISFIIGIICSLYSVIKLLLN
jgi:hypothetical protein